MKETEKTVLVGAGLIALAILGGAMIIAHKVSKSLDNVDLWKGSNIPTVASDVHNVTSGISNLVQSWIQA